MVAVDDPDVSDVSDVEGRVIATVGLYVGLYTRGFLSVSVEVIIEESVSLSVDASSVVVLVV